MSSPFDDELDDDVGDVPGNRWERGGAAGWRSVPLEFHGTGSEYFKIWIVNMALSVLTLGIYSAWAKVRTRRYFNGNTQIDGSAFEYLANPVAILKGRMLATFALVVFGLSYQLFPLVGVFLVFVLFLLTPWVMVKALRFNARVTAFRNVRFDFLGTMRRSYELFVFYAFLVPFTLGLIIPFLKARTTSFMFSGHTYGNQKFRDELPTSGVYSIYGMIVILYVVLLGGLVAVMAAAGMYDSIAELEEDSMEELYKFYIPLYAVVVLLGVFVKSFLSARIRNLLLNNANIGDHVEFESRVETWPLFTLYMGYGTLSLVTLGLAYPWLEVALARYFAERTTISLKGTLDDVVDRAAPAGSAAADQLGEAFDIDIEFGF